MKSLALLQASQLVTLAGPKRPRIGKELSELGIIRHGGMLIRDSKVDIVGTSDEIEQKSKGAEIVDLGGRVVLAEVHQRGGAELSGQLEPLVHPVEIGRASCRERV